MSTTSGDLIGKKLMSYEITERIGSGGMGAVYKALQSNIGRYVAIKMLPPELGRDEEFLARFEREALLTARMEHPVILPIYDYGQFEERPFIVMRLLNGGSLADRLRREGRLNPLEVLELLRAIANGLDYAHRQGVIHRDLKPSNILLDQEGNPFIADFGIARLSSDSAFSLTGAAAVLGTPRYMSPEQATGARVDSRSDIYSLGVMVYEMLTGLAPFEGDTPYRLIMKHISETPKSINEINSNLTLELAAVVAKALAKNPDERYATAGDFAAAFSAEVNRDVERYRAIPESTPAAEDDAKPAPMAAPPQPSVPAGASVQPSTRMAEPAAPTLEPLPEEKREPYWVWFITGGVLLVFAIFSLLNPTDTSIQVLLWLGAVGVIGYGIWRGWRERSERQRTITANVFPRVPFTPAFGQSDVEPSSPLTSNELDSIKRMMDTPENVRPKVSPRPTRSRLLSDFKEGDTFGIYKLIKRLDTGDKNRVYHAVNQNNNRVVALKLMQATSQRAMDRFRQEALILSDLQHPNIVQFWDFGVDEPFIYLVMPLLAGPSLRVRLENGALPPPTVLGLTDKFASALSYIHDKSIVHRDFRPMNIVFHGDTQPFLTEFSIAKRIDDENAVSLTIAGEVLGAPGYIAPEQRLMGEVSPASDQYSLAVVTFEMLTGAMPFDAPKSMMDNIYAKPKRPCALKPDLPKAVDDVLLRGMEMRPDDRYPDVRAFCQELEKALTNKPHTLTPSPLRREGEASAVPISQGHIFVSYSRAQSGYARKVADWLIAGGFDVWIDDQIDYGDDWWKTVVRAVETCGAMVVIMSPESEESDWVQREVGNALKFKKPIFPLLYAGENWALFVWTQYADVRVLSATGGTIDPPLPPADFLDRVAKSAPRKASPGREIAVTAVGTTAGAFGAGEQAKPMSPASAPSRIPAPQPARAGVAWRPAAVPPSPSGEGGEVKSLRYEIIRILFLSADPKDERRLRLSEELRSVDEYLRKSEYRDRFDLKEAWALQIADLQGVLLRYKPHIVHFSGHGSKEGAILLQDPAGNAAPVHPGALSNLFATLKDNIRCVVLNACYSEIQAKAIVQHIDCVIGMSYAIKDSSAVVFAGQFYQALGYGRHIQTAFNLGKNALELYDTGEEITPQMLIRDGTRADELYLIQ